MTISDRLSDRLSEIGELAGDNRLEEAIASVQLIVKENNNDYEVLLFAAGLYKCAGDLDEARRLFKLSFARKPDSIKPLVELSKIVADQGNFIDAGHYAVKASNLATDIHDDCIDVAESFAAAKLHYSALRYFKKALEFDSSSEIAQRGVSEHESLLGGYHPKVTFYIPCYNAELYIDACLQSVLAQTFRPHEIVVIDDGSTDASMELVSRYNVKVIRHEKNQGLSAGRNTAIENAEGELLASIDSDVSVTPFWLEYMVGHFSDPMVGGVNGKILEANTFRIADRWRSVHMCQNHGSEPLKAVHLLFGCDTVIRKEAIRNIGGYNRGLMTNNEDYEAGKRLEESGWLLYYEPQAVAYHMREDSLQSVIRTNSRWMEPYFDRLGLYSFYHKMRERIEHDVDMGRRYLIDDFNNNNDHIAYLSFLLPFHHILTNLIYFWKKNGEYLDRDTFQIIAKEIIDSFDILLKARSVPTNLVERVFESITPYIEELLGNKCVPANTRPIYEELAGRIHKEISQFKGGSGELVNKWLKKCSSFVHQILASGVNEVIVYGAGDVGKAFVTESNRQGLKISCLTDRNKSLWGKKIQNYPVKSLAQASKLGVHTFAVASFSYTKEIERTIRQHYSGSPVQPKIITTVE